MTLVRDGGHATSDVGDAEVVRSDHAVSDVAMKEMKQEEAVEPHHGVEGDVGVFNVSCSNKWR